MLSKLRNLAVILAALGLSFAAFANNDQKTANGAGATETAATAPAVETANINTADAAALVKVKYFGKKKAEAVVDYRNKNGKFKSVDDLLNVKAKGMTQKWLDKVKDNLTV